MPNTMRAVVFDRFGPPDVLRLEDVPVPVPGPGRVLVEVVATSLNLSDWECLVGSPLYAKELRIRSPRNRILGSDIAGRVVAVGRGVTQFVVGDEVYGDNLMLKGGFAEYTVADASMLAHKPAGLTFTQASALPQAGAIAVHGTEHVASGTRLLINGGGGGSGMFGIQLAKRAGAHVTAVDNAGKLDFMRSLGADAVIDYHVEDFTRTGPYDRVLDLVAKRSPLDYVRVLAPGGRYRAVGGSMRSLLGIVSVGTIAARLRGRRVGMLLVRTGPSRFVPLADRCVAGDIDIRIDRTYSLADTPEALARVGEGRALGKVVVEVGDQLS
ncbi:NAD(P)-dependent alcohol dehydrogenase [Microbacterium sp. Mu-80]|uniref:NAD(P)-dependent alcohol dehydrogenase n=1 Tax=Microbacterium bandirmense TaxID=3122050 RepID=A0ABU8LEJ3_9MICO